MSETVERAVIAGDSAWEALGRELALWAAASLPASLWWRDDDAAAVTPALERLLALQAEHAVALALAVIPDGLAPGLIACLAGCEGIAILQHGYRHRNHAGKGEGAWEFGDHRPLEQMAEDLAAGQRQLAEAFGEHFLPVLAPPWNRISARVVEDLPALGFVGLTTFGARVRAAPAPGLVQVNAHCDPISWKRGGRFAGTGRALDDLIGHLQARRTGAVDPAEPTGFVTHHSALDPSAWAFVAELLRRTCAHPGAAWLDAREVFPAMTVLPAGIELRSAAPADRDAVVALLHERMSSKLSALRWRRLFDYPWLVDKPDCGVVVLERGTLTGYLGVIYADRRRGGRTVRTANLSSWYIVRSLRGQGIGLAMLQHATRDPGLSYTTFSSNPPALRLMAEAGLVLLDDTRLLWRRTGEQGVAIEVLSGFEALLPEIPDHERQLLADHRELAVQPHLLRSPDGDCLVVLTVKKKGADVAYHEVLHLGRPEVFARHAQAFADAVLAPAAAVLAVDRRFLDGCAVTAETKAISVPRYFRSPDLKRREVDFLYSEIPLLDLKLY